MVPASFLSVLPYLSRFPQYILTVQSRKKGGRNMLDKSTWKVVLLGLSILLATVQCLERIEELMAEQEKLE